MQKYAKYAKILKTNVGELGAMFLLSQAMRDLFLNFVNKMWDILYQTTN